MSVSPSVALLTCSMARDIGLFELLASSVDTHVDEAVPHRVVVPAADLQAFKRFASSRREIIAQEDVLPVRIWKAPAALRHLAILRAGFGALSISPRARKWCVAGCCSSFSRST